MGESQTIVEVYNDAMRIFGRGHAFYLTVPGSKLRPGMCGYIDNNGLWNNIVDLTDQDALAAKGFTAPTGLEATETDSAVWGHITSSGVNSKHVIVEAGADGGGGVGAKVKLKISSENQSGAVLVCNTPVVLERLQNAYALKKWAKVNRRRIQKTYPLVSQFGFYVAQGIWSSEDVYISAWVGKQKSFFIEGTVVAGNTASGSVSISYKQETAAGEWFHPISTTVFSTQNPHVLIATYT
ncbi:hypothetical protein K4K51_002620 [Colletotrichum sp. SAR 10_75]|nr:hypothetical protein K4K51_002620 [Colletotrichum sp. SAR 10_75]